LKGLDVSEQRLDGSFTYVYTDPAKQVVFHVATLMPNQSPDRGGVHLKKKSHIGNDYVVIVWNESGRPYSLDTISGQFAFVAVVIEPEDDEYLAVEMLSKKQIDKWFALRHAVVSDSSAPVLCRQMAIQAQLGSHIWTEDDHGNEPYVGRVVNRFQNIRRIRNKYSSAGSSSAHGHLAAYM
jgi:tuberous sclerosis protein 2